MSWAFCLLSTLGARGGTGPRLFRGPHGCGQSPKSRGAGRRLEEEGPKPAEPRMLHRLPHSIVTVITRVENYSCI